MKVTKKHFIQLAKLLRENLPSNSKTLEMWLEIGLGIMLICEESNPKFNSKKFMDAAIWPKNEEYM